MPYQKNEPYNDLPPLPPAKDLATKPVLLRLVSASRALAELKGAGNLIPNQAILINAIPLQEAQVSSAIENIVTTQDALFRAAVEDPKRVDPATREVLRYRSALREGYERIQKGPINLDLIVGLCSALLKGNACLRDNEPIIIEAANAQAVVYTPPRGRGAILALLENLVQFLRATGDLDPLLKMAVAHYQFEAIHPFLDGNGRTGRILNILVLLQHRLLEIPVLFLSHYIIRHKQEYYARLRAVTEQGDWEGWLLYMLAAVEATATETTTRIRTIRELLDDTLALCRTELPPRVYSKELVELIFVQPYIRIQTVVDAGLAGRETASEYLRELARLGVLERERHGREVLYRHPALLRVLKG